MEKDKIRIAIIAGQLVVGGAERQLYLWLSNLDRSRFSPVVLTLHPGHGDYWEKPIENLDIPLFRISPQKNRIKRLFDIINILKQSNPQIIHGWHLFTSPYAGLSAILLGAIGLGSLRDSIRKFYQHFLSALFTLIVTDGIIVNSKSAAIELQKVRLRTRQRCFIIQNALVNHTARYRSRNDLISCIHLNETKTIVGSIGRLDQKKRFDLLLKTMALLKTEHPYHLIIIGDGPERENLEKLTGRLGIIDRVTFMGEIANAEAWLKAFDIFAYTSLDEGMPNVIMEAAAAELPIITWQLPFYEELLTNEVSGLLVEPKNIEKMKECIIRLATSEELRLRLGKAARGNMLENFSLERYIHNMTNAYETVLTTSNKNRGIHQA